MKEFISTKPHLRYKDHPRTFCGLKRNNACNIGEFKGICRRCTRSISGEIAKNTGLLKVVGKWTTLLSEDLEIVI